ncbi:hypothetical protein BT69DRAFT_1330595 [Atractiella rhizophila]|nr:hypothetical protein BT69DRAFT_1330595 [Atractiella rhizophila]
MDRLDSALSFLRDSSVHSYPLATKIHYLESKGLSAQEIDQALKLGGIISAAAGGKLEERKKDWKDWFVMLVIGGAAGWLATLAARKYLLPALQPPSQSELTEAQLALEAKYEEASSLLSTLQTNSDSLRSSLLEQKAAVDRELQEVRELVDSLRGSEAERRETFRSVRNEVESIRELVPRLIEKSKESQLVSLGELQNELKSLKNVLLSRPPTTPTGSRLTSGGLSSSGLISPRPGIPAWQLAANNSATGSDKGKEKEREPPVENPKPAANSEPVYQEEPTG